MADPLILFVPGLRPKPEPDKHSEAMQRCLLEGLRRLNAGFAQKIQATDDWFQLVDWNYAFYNEYHDITADLAGIEEMLQQEEASEEDLRKATSFSLRFSRALYRLGDHMHFLIPRLASPKVQMHLRDLRRYVKNRDKAATRARQALIGPLLQAAARNRPVLLIGHSMGSVIAWDALWLLSQEPERKYKLDTLMTMGSPLGQRFMQRRILGHDKQGADKYPSNILDWINVAAVGELTALDVDMQNDFSEMLDLKLVNSIEDHECWNYFHTNGEFNPHSEYGYLINEVTAKIVMNWWSDAAMT